MVKYIYFDFDGVLTTDPRGAYSTCSYLGKKIHMSTESLIPMWKHCSKELYFGNETLEKTWACFCQKVEKDLDIALVYEAFEATPKNMPMLALCNELRTVCHLGIITDNPQERMDILTEQWGLRAQFDPIITSAKAKCFKKDTHIFSLALESVGALAGESVFIDNKQENLVVPAAMGMQTYFHNQEVNDVHALRKQLCAWGIAV